MNIILLNYILFITILLMFYMFTCFNISLDDNCKSYKIYKKILYSDIISQVKSGDLVFFDNTLTSIYERTFGHPQFSHVGIIIEINKEIYICDLNPDNIFINNKKIIKKGINIVPFYDRIYNYNGYVYISSLKHPLTDIQKQKLITIINKNNIDFLSTYKILYSYIFNINYIYKNEMLCNEYIAYILDELQITNNLSKSNKKDLHNNIIELSNSDLYYNPVHIIIDNLIIKNLYNYNYKCIANC